jgi:hypothetical protein
MKVYFYLILLFFRSSVAIGGSSPCFDSDQFILSGDGCYDSVNNLQWGKPFEKLLDFPSASSLCQSMENNLRGDFTAWRLPTHGELQALVRQQASLTSWFPINFYWTSSAEAVRSKAVLIDEGDEAWLSIESKLGTVCVRSGLDHDQDGVANILDACSDTVEGQPLEQSGLRRGCAVNQSAPGYPIIFEEGKRLGRASYSHEWYFKSHSILDGQYLLDMYAVILNQPYFKKVSSRYSCRVPNAKPFRTVCVSDTDPIAHLIIDNAQEARNVLNKFPDATVTEYLPVQNSGSGSRWK